MIGDQTRRWKTEFKPVKLCLKIDFASHPAPPERFVKNGGARGVMVITIGNGHDDPSSHP